MTYPDHATIIGAIAGAIGILPAAGIIAASQLADLALADILALVGSGGAVTVLALALLLAREVRAAVEKLTLWRPIVRVQVVEDQEVTGVRKPPQP